MCPNRARKKEGKDMYCKYCGQQIEDGAKFCQHCGGNLGAETKQEPVKQAAPEAPQQPVVNVINQNTNVNSNVGYIHKRKWVAFFLCLFLGCFGVHRFYVGKVGTGIIWLLTFGLCGIGWFLDLIIILFGGFRDKIGQPLL